MAFLRDLHHYKFHLTRLFCSEEETAEDGDLLHKGDDKNKRRSRLSVSYITCLNVIIFLLSLSLFSISIYRLRGRLNGELRASSTWSPIYDALDLEMVTKRINGTLFTPSEHSIARQMPNSAADGTWEEWELTRVFPVTRADIIRLGKDPETAVKLDPEIWGLGDDAYATALDIYHQLHCVNTLRQIAYGTYYNMQMGNPDANNATLREMHINHCVDILMQAIQCSGNANLITFHWVEKLQRPFPDMSIDRKCINFDKLTDWRLANTIDMKKWAERMKKPNGAKEGKMEDQYYGPNIVQVPKHHGRAHEVLAPEQD
ncbi:hypothetical protein V8C43DRAFT_326016 [Trichoderma afarasin]